MAYIEWSSDSFVFPGLTDLCPLILAVSVLLLTFTFTSPQDMSWLCHLSQLYSFPQYTAAGDTDVCEVQTGSCELSVRKDTAQCTAQCTTQYTTQ